MTLNAKQKKAFKAKYDLFKDDVIEYGGDPNMNILPCKRLKRPNQVYDVLGTPYPAYKITWIHLNGRLKPIDPKKTDISHICDTPRKPKNKSNNKNKSKYPLCIEIKHMNPETHGDNTKRRTCHKSIRKYANTKRTKYAKKKKIKKGPFFVRNIPFYIRKNGLEAMSQQVSKRKYTQRKSNDNDNNNANVNTITLRRSARLKNKLCAKTTKPLENNNNNMMKIVCNHKPKCFINY